VWALAGACPPQSLTLLPRSAPVFENSSRIVIVMEYASRGDLYDYISGRQQLSEREARHFFRQIVSAVHHCHQVSRWPGLASPERPRGSPGPHGDTEIKARCASPLRSVGISGFKSLGWGWKDLWFVVPIKMGSLPICAYPAFAASSLSRLGLHVRLP